MLNNWLVRFQESLKPETELLGYELRICNKKDKTFFKVRVSSIKEAFERVGVNRYDHNFDVTVYNLDTNYFIKIHDHTSSRYHPNCSEC